MADISSPILDVSRFLDEPVKTPVKQEPAAPLDNFFESYTKEEHAATEAAARWSKQYDPEAYAQAQKLAPDVAPEIGVRQLDVLKDAERLDSYRKVFENSPQLRGYFASAPKDLAYANPDELDAISGLEWMGYAGKEAVDEGYIQYQAAMASNRIARGQGTIRDQAFVNNYEGTRTFGARGFWDEAFVQTAQQVPQLALTGLHAARGALVGSVAGGGTGAAIGSVVPGPGTVAGGAAGMLAGAEAGGALGAYTFQQELQTGLARLDFQRLRDENGKPLEPELIEMAAAISGSGGALLELVSTGAMLKTIPGADRMIGLLKKEGLETALKVPSVRAALLNFAKNVGVTSGTEITTEVLQQGLQITAGEMAKAASDGSFAQKTPAEIAEELGMAAYQAAQVMAIMGPLAAGTRFGADIREVNQSKRGIDSLKKVLDQMDGNPLVERAPDVAAKLIDAQIGPDKKLYIDAQQFKELYQSQGLDIYGPALPNWRNKLDEALATGGTVQTTVGEFVAHLGKDPKNNPLVALVQTSPGGYSAGEIELWSQTLDQILQSEVAGAQAVSVDMPSGVSTTGEVQVVPEIEALKKQIAQAGFAPPAIEQYTTLLSAFFNTMAQRSGRTTSDLFQEFALSIMGGTVNDVNRTPQSDNEFFQSAWHGSPHEFDKFDLSYLGSGEGFQSFGWGLYFAESQSLAEHYRATLSKKHGKGEHEYDSFKIMGDPRKVYSYDTDYKMYQDAVANPMSQTELVKLRQLRDDLYADLPAFEDPARQDHPLYKTWIQAAKRFRIAEQVSKGYVTAVPGKKVGRLYKVELPENEHLLVFDDKLSEQPERVKDAIKRIKVQKPGWFSKTVDKLRYEMLQDAMDEKNWDKFTGDDLYSRLSQVNGGREKGGDKKASMMLAELGVPGHRFLDGRSRKKGDGTYNYVMYDDDAVSIEEYFQQNKGSISFDGTKAVIRLFDQADMSTLLHEAGHFFLNTLRETAKMSPDIKADWDIIRKHLKIGEDGKITRDQHEQFARMAEAYFMEGKAPAPELRNAFAAFARWLKVIYRSIRQLGGKVKPEIAGVFDRMLVTEQRFAELAADTAYAPLFKTAEDMGVTPEEYLEYQKLAEDLRDEAQVKSVERIVGQANRLAKGWQGQIQKELEKEATAKLLAQPPYSHMATFKAGKVSIDPVDFTEKYSKVAAKAFPSYAFKAKGLPVEVASEILGYVTTDEMVNDFANAPPIKEAAKEMAAKEMAQRYGEDFDQSEIMTLAIKQQMADEGRLLLLGKELSALSRKNGRTTSEKGPKQLATQIARNNIYSKAFKDLSPVQTQAAVRKAASMALSAIVKGDWKTAADWKRKQLLAQAIDNETQNAIRVVDKIRSKGARYSRGASKTVDPGYMEQIRAIVEKYDFAKISKKKLASRENLRSFLEKAAEDGQVTLAIPDRLLRDAERISYKELSVEDLIDIGDTIDNLEHLGRTKSKIKTRRAAAEFADVKQTMIDSIRQRPSKKVKMKTYTEKQQGIMDWATEFHASWLKPEQIIEWLDMGDIKGPMMEHIFQPIVEAQNYQNELNLEYNGRITKIFEDIDSKYLNETVLIPSLATKMTRQEIYAVALNTGNESNRKKMLEGELWTEPQLADILSHLDKKDWERIQKVWNVLDGLWEKIAAMEKRLTGVAPPKIEAREINNVHGTWDGGYYPVVYDFESQRGMNLLEDTTPKGEIFANDLFSRDQMTPGTSHKHTVKRTKVAKPIKLELGILPAHLHKVVHDLAYREAVRGAYKLLWDADVKKSIIDVEGKATYQQLQHWLRSVATEKMVETDPNVRFISRIRTGTTMFGMGYRLSTALAQPLGFFTSMTRVGKANLASAIIQMTRHPIRTMEMVNGLSGEMKSRFNTQDRDIHDTMKKLSIKSSKLDVIRGYAFSMIGWADKYVATATWLGAYQDYISKHPGEQDIAVQHADRTVRLTQGTGTVKDMAKITNNGEILKLFTMFYSFFSAQYNMQVDLTRKTRNDINAGDWQTILTERLPQWAYLVVFPAIFGALVTGQGPEDDENKALWALRKTVLYPLSAVPFVRDIVPAIDGGYAGKFSPAGKFLEESSKAIMRMMESNQELGDRFAKALKPAASAAAIALKLPAGQAINSIEGLWKGLANGDFEYKDLYLGRRDK